jgi:hypothetical protein
VICRFDGIHPGVGVKVCTDDDLTPDAKAKGVVAELCGRDLDAETAARVGALLLYVATIDGHCDAFERALMARSGIDADGAACAAETVIDALEHMFEGSEI